MPYKSMEVLSPQIRPGEANRPVGFEAAEALRWRHMLRPADVGRAGGWPGAVEPAGRLVATPIRTSG